ncbi:hypothetical protein LTR62_007432 [Meristemomyces frigidus]|uniref:Uncharacterized protein n=1 Tax=Meristemomyces frigidus TaxID=1508187 RepID=A0AAN7TIC8_9PEZI|nr:hypothetical protein LTR62_007432 [Meristemomyces frigidus]
MPVAWTAEKDQKLLIFALELGMINPTKVAELWSQREGDEVSARAVSQHLLKLRAKVSKGDDGSGTPKSTPGKPKSATPRKNTADPKTPKGSAKRKAMSDEDDTEEEYGTRHTGTPSKREKSARAASKPPNPYAGLVEEDADDEIVVSKLKREDSADPAAASAARGTVRDLDAMSDVSDFNPDGFA